jgi:hypothetical protein
MGVPSCSQTGAVVGLTCLATVECPRTQRSSPRRNESQLPGPRRPRIASNFKPHIVAVDQTSRPPAHSSTSVAPIDTRFDGLVARTGRDDRCHRPGAHRRTDLDQVRWRKSVCAVGAEAVSTLVPALGRLDASLGRPSDQPKRARQAGNVGAEGVPVNFWQSVQWHTWTVAGSTSPS